MEMKKNIKDNKDNISKDNKTGKELESLAIKFSNKIPKETNFNNIRSNKYFGKKNLMIDNEKGTLRSIATIKINYGTLRSNSEIVNENNIRLSIPKFHLDGGLLKVMYLKEYKFNNNNNN